MCSNKASAFTVVKACNITELLRCVPAAQRVAALDSPSVRAAFAQAGLDANIMHLVAGRKAPNGHLDKLMRAAIARRYGGKSGMLSPAVLDLDVLHAGDFVTLLRDAELLRFLCETLPAGAPCGFSDDMAIIAGTTVPVVGRSEKRYLAIRLPAGCSAPSAWIPLDVIQAQFTPAEYSAWLVRRARG